MTEELTQVREAFLAIVQQRAPELYALERMARCKELAQIAAALLPDGQAVAELFAANCHQLDGFGNNLHGMAGDLDAWGTDAMACVTTDAIRYAIARFLMSEAGERID